MMIPEEIRQKYGVPDADVSLLVDFFDEPVGSRVLVVGCHDEPSANMLAASGFKVVGIDLREYDPKMPPCNFEYVRGDFCNMPGEWLIANYGKFDAFVSLSAIEHFGLEAYGEGMPHKYYDVIAMRQAWQLLRVGGKAYVTVPWAEDFYEFPPHWRIYSPAAANERLVQDFRLNGIQSRLGAPTLGLDGKVYDQTYNEKSTIVLAGITPNVSAILLMEKVRRVRLAPDGR